MNEKAKATLSVQWHITSRCMKHCRHCYMFENERYRTEIENELKFSDMLKILDDIEDFEKKWNFAVNDFFVTGGDPVLNQDYMKLLLEIKNRGKKSYLMGNPETLTAEVLDNLKTAEIQQMQMSLDGLEKLHDFYRGKGNFATTIKALELLDKHGIIATIMFTLTGENKHELIPLMKFVSRETKAKGFAFDLVCGVGSAKDIPMQLTKEELKDIFTDYLTEKKRIKEERIPIRISEKSKFFQLLHFNNNEFYPYDYDEFIATGGCYTGFTCYTILADGSVAACRRFPTIIGKMPEEKIEKIFFENDLLKRFRRASSYEKCGSCAFYKNCRGCPAVTYGYFNDPFRENPLCFKDLIDRKIDDKKWKSPSIDTTMQEEADIVRSMLHNQYSADYDQFTSNDDFLLLVGTLISSKEERNKFFVSPNKYVNDYYANAKLSDKEIAYACYYVECVLQNRIPNPIKYALDM